MKTVSSDAAFARPPVEIEDEEAVWSGSNGLTKLTEIPEYAVNIADALIEALNKTKE